MKTGLEPATSVLSGQLRVAVTISKTQRWKTDSNCRPSAYEAAALPAELFQRIKEVVYIMERFEPHRVPPWPEDPTANIGHGIAVKVPDPRDMFPSVLFIYSRILDQIVQYSSEVGLDLTHISALMLKSTKVSNRALLQTSKLCLAQY